MGWLSALLLSLATSSQSSGHASIELGTCLASPQPSIVVRVVSVQRSMRVALTPKEFDEYIRASGADYVLTIQDSERAKLVGQFLAALDIEAVRSDAESIGVRYRLECNARGKPKRTLYITKFGSIVDGRHELRPRNGEAWLSELWGVLQEDVLLMRSVPSAGERPGGSGSEVAPPR